VELVGYYIHLRDQNFLLPADQKYHALGAIKEATADLAAKGRSYSWVTMSHLLQAKTLEDALEEFGWKPQVDSDGNITGFDFWGTKIGSEEELFSIIAPYVEDNSYLEVGGEEGAMWRWAFKDNELREDSPTIAWPQ
jgi:hypothetical protein